jgi:cytochrome c peroxidase
MRRAAVAVLGIAAAILTIAIAAPPAWHWNLPDGIRQPQVPVDNPMSAAKVELGRRLFYDADLSINGTMSCATCHSQRHGFADDNRTRPGVHGDPGRRNVPGLANVAWAQNLTWANSQLTTLEAQVAVPVLGEHPVEMGMKGREADIAARLGRDACYVQTFRAAFPEVQGAIDMTTIAKALAAFERTMIAFDTPFDRYRRGRMDAITPAAQRGVDLFYGAATCSSCHGGLNFTDDGFHALIAASGNSDHGLGEVTGVASDDYKFRTPDLRNVALTQPYMHDGEARTLTDAIRRHQSVVAVSRLPEGDVSDLIAFLGALTDQGFVTNPHLALPMTACGRRL